MPSHAQPGRVQLRPAPLSPSSSQPGPAQLRQPEALLLSAQHGFSQAQASSAKRSHVQPSRVELNQAHPSQSLSSRAWPHLAKPRQAYPGPVPAQTSPLKPSHAKLSRAQASQARPSAIQLRPAWPSPSPVGLLRVGSTSWKHPHTSAPVDHPARSHFGSRQPRGGQVLATARAERPVPHQVHFGRPRHDQPQLQQAAGPGGTACRRHCFRSRAF